MTTPTASYDPSLAAARDRLRFTLGDTDVAAFRAPDATYDAVLASVGNDERSATIALAEAFAAAADQEPDEVDVQDGATTRWKDKARAWRALAQRLRDEIAREQARASSTWATLRAQRPGDTERAEYYAGERPPWYD